MNNWVVALTDLKIVFKVAAITYFTVAVNLDRLSSPYLLSS